MIALVTGGSRGIGRAIAIRLAQEGHYILINYAGNTAAAEETLRLVREAGSEGELMRFDVSNREETVSAITEWQESHPDAYIAILVNNAGIRRDNILPFMEGEDFDRVMETNLFSFYNVTRPVLTPMISHKFGRIVNMASLSGVKGMAGQVNYSASKGGLIAATKALAQEVAKKRVTVNAVAPGFVKTDMVEGLDEATLKQHIPAGRFGRPEEVAALVGFLCSADASYITGECINVNGGLYT